MPPKSVEQLLAQLAERDKRIEELERERDDWKAIAEDSTLEAGKLIVKWKARAEKAERALGEALAALDDPGILWIEAAKILRAALRSEDTSDES